MESVPLDAPPRPGSPSAHPLGLAPPPSGQLEVPPGAYVHLGPALPNNALGTAEWLPDEASSNCMRCGEEFTAFTRRHHCRQCGQLFCHRCCNSKALLQPGSGTAPEERGSAHPVWGAGETDERAMPREEALRKPRGLGGSFLQLLAAPVAGRSGHPGRPG